ncbi:hypothetical protein OpiT1DRAFT_02458 [Opitutaceae bacterium TAV1]|nr:hypothetical protein OpiT1DRAFT_02458 [Opitutaceae bacterium TAV1]
MNIPAPRLLLPCAALSAIILAAPALSAPSAAGEKNGGDGENPWSIALRLDYATADARFAQMHAAAPDDARATIGYACTLLVRQPRTEGNIGKARALLMHTAEAASTETEERILCRYLAARIDQDHRSPARPDDAVTAYENLVRDYPGHELADQAAVQLALIFAFGPPQPDKPSGAAAASPDDVVARIEELLAGARHAEARRELHIVLARFHWQARQAVAPAIAHLLAARRIPCEKPFRDAELDLMIGSLAQREGDAELAVAHYEAFAEANRRDPRTGTVRRLVAGLKAASAQAASGHKTPARP